MPNSNEPVSDLWTEQVSEEQTMSLTETIGAYLRDHPEEAKHLRPAITLANGETVREFRNGAALVRYSVWYAAQEGTPHAHQD